MAVLTFNKYQTFVADLANKQHNLGTDVIKIALTNTAPNAATHTAFADITEIATGNGYAAGGATVTISSSSQTGGTYTLVAGANVTFTATGGSIGPYQYVVAYNSTSDSLISYYDIGASTTLAADDSHVFNINGTTLVQVV